VFLLGLILMLIALLSFFVLRAFKSLQEQHRLQLADTPPKDESSGPKEVSLELENGKAAGKKPEVSANEADHSESMETDEAPSVDQNENPFQSGGLHCAICQLL
jgi:hypothetical protein